MIYKIIDTEAWRQAKTAGFFAGAAIDLQDGYMHFSTAAQVAETASMHFAGREGLLLLYVDETLFGPELKWELSRGGALFPHLYAPLAVASVQRVEELLWNGTSHDFPADMP